MVTDQWNLSSHYFSALVLPIGVHVVPALNQELRMSANGRLTGNPPAGNVNTVTQLFTQILTLLTPELACSWGD